MSDKDETCITPSHKERDSNMELMRIITMMMILLLHADFITTGCPGDKDAVMQPFVTLSKSYIEALTVIGVNVFVLLSGWYSIHPKQNRLVGLIVQVVFFHLVGLTFAFATQQSVNWRSIVSFMEGLWFVKAYLLLNILSPVLNTFTDHIDRQTFKYVLIGFFLMQSVYGWLPPDYNMPFTKGFSTISFIGLYLLARYVRIYKPHYSLWRARTYLFVYLLLSLVITLIYYARIRFTVPLLPLIGDMYTYTSPLVILSSLTFLLLFSKLSLRSKVVNILAKSCFAVYLLHVNKYIWPYFDSAMSTLYQAYTYIIYLLYSTTLCIIIYAIAIFLDRIRLYLWGKMQ